MGDGPSLQGQVLAPPTPRYFTAGQTPPPPFKYCSLSLRWTENFRDLHVSEGTRKGREGKEEVEEEVQGGAETAVIVLPPSFDLDAAAAAT